MPSVIPRERFLTALDHQESDRVPFDLGSTFTTGIHHIAYSRLRKHMGLPGGGTVMDLRQGLAFVDYDFCDALKVDAVVVASSGPDPAHWQLDIRDDGEYREFEDEFGMGWRSPRVSGLYFDQMSSPLAGDVSVADIDAYSRPDPPDPHRFTGMRGLEQFFMDMLTARAIAEALLDKALQTKLASRPLGGSVQGRGRPR